MAHKKILGLDLGTTSIGWAFVHEFDDLKQNANIIDLGVRVNPISADQKGNFEKGQSITLNAERTLKRSMRKNLNRYQDRRQDLIDTLKRAGFITENTLLSEAGKNTTHATLKMRDRAASEKVSLENLAKVLLMINKKRGYKSTRKTRNNEEEGEAIDGMQVAKELYDKHLTPGEYCLNQLKAGKKRLPDFYRSDLKNEFLRIWQNQYPYDPNRFTDEILNDLIGKPKKQTWKICEKHWGIEGITLKGTREEKKLMLFQLRVDALTEQLNREHLTVVLQEINNQINQSSGYLGEISDRSKELYFNNQTVGQNLYARIKENPNARIKGLTFYREDYLDEFEKIWETQAQFYPELTSALKEEIRDTIIFYQRRLKTQKGSIGFCEFESKEKELEVDGKLKTKTIGSRVCPRASPLFQEFKIWQNLNSVEITNKHTLEKFALDQDTKQMLFDELNIRGVLKDTEFLKLFVDKPADWVLNFKAIEGNHTNALLYDAYVRMMEIEGHEVDRTKIYGTALKSIVKDFFDATGIHTDILEFNSEVDGVALERQAHYQLWHLLYSFEEDPMKKDHQERLIEKLMSHFNFPLLLAKELLNVSFIDDYSSLSAKAIKKIFPYIKEHTYSDACNYAGYNHSHSITKEENDKRALDDRLEILPKNSLRNPIVEKILNQMINVVNAIIGDPSMGRPDEIRVELARELKKGAKERQEMTDQINKSKREHDQHRKTLHTEFGLQNPTRNDIIRYKLYLELAPLGFKTPYSQTYIAPDKLFSKSFDIEHIIPQSRLFDDSFSNKTLELRDINIEKGNRTASDFIMDKYGEKGHEEYIERVKIMAQTGDRKISKGKLNKLLMSQDEIPDEFLNRDLRNSQYVAKKSIEILKKVVKQVTTTSGSITAQLREDWDLVNIMKELNMEKYRRLGMTEEIVLKDGKKKEMIKDWTKRNDHRHHAVDALTVAFTRPGHIQYLNYLNARLNEKHKKHVVIHKLENKLTAKKNGKRMFIAPMDNFREESKSHLEQVLVSYKSSSKVTSRSVNRIQTKDGVKKQMTLAPRGQLHNESIYGRIMQSHVIELPVGSKMSEEIVAKVSHDGYRRALENRLDEYGGDPKKAFSGANSPKKKPIYTDDHLQLPEKVKVVDTQRQFVIRKAINPDNFKTAKAIDKVVDQAMRKLLMKRLELFDGDAKMAFSNLEENPIQDESGNRIKKVRVKAINNGEPIHEKRDLDGEIMKANGENIPSDYVSLGNNHHVAFYEDDQGKLIDEVVSFWHAVERAKQGIPIVERVHPKGYKFLFSLKQNDCVVFPGKGFDPTAIDLELVENRKLISANLFRVQKFSKSERDIVFRHHLETTLNDDASLKNIVFKRVKSLKGLHGMVKVRVNHLGHVVHVGE